MAEPYPTDISMNLLRIILKSQNVSHEQIISEAEVFEIKKEETEKALATLELNGLVDHSGDIFYTTSKGTIIANKSSVLW